MNAGWIGIVEKTESANGCRPIPIPPPEFVSANPDFSAMAAPKDSQEIEFILQYPSTTWISIGWKPQRMTASQCAGPVPEIEPPGYLQLGNPLGEPEPEGEPSSSFKQSDAETEPENEPVPENETAPEPEPENSSSEQEPNSEVESASEPKPEGISESEPNPEAELKSKGVDSKSESEPVPDGESTELFHPMACTDIVAGFAVGDLSRVADYYTVSRATPWKDEFYGGSQSLTAAFAFEQDGITSLMFRKKLEASDSTDHSIGNEDMTVIWAKGMVNGRYKDHAAMTPNSDLLYYRYDKDMLKYHGVYNRGKFTVNFLDSSISSGTETEAPSPEPEKSGGPNCSGSYNYPIGCSGDSCEYIATYSVLEKKVEFLVRATIGPGRWTGIGFSPVGAMRDADIVLAEVNADSTVSVTDRYSTSWSPPPLDSEDSNNDVSAKYDKGTLEMSFSRNMIDETGIEDADLSSECVFLLYPVKGGPLKGKSVGYHSQTPKVSEKKICFHKCSISR